MVYDLEFWIGNTKCVLADVTPFSTRAHNNGKYYEHCHPCFEFHYIEEGASVFSCNKNNITVSKDQILIIPPRMYHQEIFSDAGTVKTTVSVDISPSADSPADRHFYNVYQRDAALTVTANPALKDELRKIKEIALRSNKSHTERESLRAHAHLFLAELYVELSNNSPKCTIYQKDSTLSREYEIDTHLALNFMSNSSKNELAQKLHISTRHLHRIMLKSYGKGYREKLREIRLEIALHFLSSTSKSITEISEEMGYSSIECFSVFIKKATGKTPTQIRKEANGAPRSEK